MYIHMCTPDGGRDRVSLGDAESAADVIIIKCFFNALRGSRPIAPRSVLIYETKRRVAHANICNWIDLGECFVPMTVLLAPGSIPRRLIEN